MDKCTMLKYIAASPNLTSYVVGASVTLMCVIDPDLLFLSFSLSFLLSSSMLTSMKYIYGSVMVALLMEGLTWLLCEC